MNDQAITRLEAKLEQLIEGAFAQLFSKSIRAQDIALHLSRSMETGLRPASDGDPRPFAPDRYIIRLHPDICDHLLIRQPELPRILAEHVVELVSAAGYRLSDKPTIELIAAPNVEASEVIVDTAHQNGASPSTAIMNRIEISETPAPQNPQLIINGKKTVLLLDTIVNIGRSRDNHITLDDPYISRHHAQLRLRFGVYTIFDTGSHGGMLVNDVSVREHRLQPGDVIRLGKTQLVYLEDTPQGDGQTDVREPLDL